MAESSEIKGVVEDVIFRNEDNGYTVCTINCEGNPVTCVGYTAFLAEGEDVSLTGSYITHIEYGTQFKFDYCEKILPTGKNNLYRYLASGIISGVRESMAKKLIDAFGESVLDVIAETPEKLAQISGISHEKAMKIGQSYLELRGAQELVMFLQEYGVSVNMAIKIYKKFGSAAKELIGKNPYILAEEITSIGFKTADRIAMNMGIAYNDEHRVKAAVLYIMEANAANNGHTRLLREQLIDYTISLIGVSDVEADNAIVTLTAEKKLFAEQAKEDQWIYLSRFYHAEAVIAKRLVQLSQNVYDSMKEERLLSQIEKIESEQGIRLAEEQREAVLYAAQRGTLIVTGGPGTGKTTIIKTIIEIFENWGLTVCLAAPTGRAAKRMSEVCGGEAKTIHRLLEINFSDDETNSKFSKNEESPLDEDVIIVDEMSMVDTLLFAALLKAVKPASRLIMIGDCDQLASVGAGNVLEDLIQSGQIKTIALSKIFRQAEESMIVVNAHRINEGYLPILNKKGKDFFFLTRMDPASIINALADLCKNRIPKQYRVNPMTDIQVLCPTKKGNVGSVSFNSVLQQVLNPSAKNKREKKFGDRIFRVGDKVMQIRNNYEVSWKKKNSQEEGIGVFNGDLGFISKIDSGLITVQFDDEKLVEYDSSRLEELEHAYAITIHKSQGSEFPIVVIPLYHAPAVLMTRNLLYTAVTRAKQLIIMVGRRDVLEAMIENDTEKDRYTGLLDKIKLASSRSDGKIGGDM